MRAWSWFLGFIIVVILAEGLFGCYQMARAHSDACPGHNQWFEKLKSKGGQLCCSVNDGVVVADADWTVKDGHYSVLVNGEWIPVPDAAVLDEPNLCGPTLVWPVKNMWGTVIRCFIPGTLS